MCLPVTPELRYKGAKLGEFLGLRLLAVILAPCSMRDLASRKESALWLSRTLCLVPTCMGKLTFIYLSTYIPHNQIHRTVEETLPKSYECSVHVNYCLISFLNTVLLKRIQYAAPKWRHTSPFPRNCLSTPEIGIFVVVVIWDRVSL